MYYTASSVLDVLTKHPKLFVDYEDTGVPFPVPACPKPNDPHYHCRDDFPECEGKTLACFQKLLIKSKRGENPHYVNFYYFYNSAKREREGKVSKQDAGLKVIKKFYTLDEDKLEDA